MTTNEMTAEFTISEYQQCVTELWDALMGLEMQLVEQLEVHQLLGFTAVVNIPSVRHGAVLARSPSKYRTTAI